MPTPAVEPNEVLYRQISTGGSPIYFDPNRAPLVHSAALLPSHQDTDGLSLIRSRFRSAIWAAYRAEKPAVRFRLVALQARELRQLDSTGQFPNPNYLPTTDGLDERFGEPWAHCVAIHINRADYENDRNAKVRIKEWALAVANGITLDSICGPFDEPGDSVPYRPAKMIEKWH